MMTFKNGDGSEYFVSWQKALARLKAGNRHFVQNCLTHPREGSDRREALAEGQQPFAVILSCADSRVVPELVFDQGLGDLFVVRVAGNVANVSTIASIEYAVAHLGVHLIVVMGHEGCGAVKAALEGADNGRNLKHLLAYIGPAIRDDQPNELNDVVKRMTKYTSGELEGNSPIISKAVVEGDLKIQQAFYHLKTGSVDFLS